VLEGREKEAFDLALDVANKVGEPATFTDHFFYHYTFSNCYLALKKIDLAETHIKKLDSLETQAEFIRGPLRRSVIYGQQAQLFMARKQYRKAREYYKKYFDFPLQADGTLANNINAYLRLIYMDSILNDNAAAVAHYKLYTKLLDSSFKITKVRQAEELQVIYQINEKENQIVSLTQQATLEKANSEKAALVRNITIAGIFVMLLIAGLLYRQNRLRKRNSQVISEKNGQLQQLLSEKEWLLKEIHHRVKNNLQTVVSLLESQSSFLEKDALQAVQSSQHRVYAMSLIHQKLYQENNMASINMAVYLPELVEYLADSFEVRQRIRFQLDIAQISVDVSQAVPIGLILNEAITNSIKYAFPNEGRNEIKIAMQYLDDGQVQLRIADNGIGLPADFRNSRIGSLGIKLMKGLTEDIGGHFVIENDNGTSITVQFSKDAIIEHIKNNVTSTATAS